MASWRVAKSLLHLRAQIDAAAPSRNKSWDGTIGDTSHQARKSDHNPDDDGVVLAMDITNDPAHGVDSEKLANALKDSKDPRISYIISNRKISNPSIEGGAWRHYGGTNPHDHHCHISVKKAGCDDERDWQFRDIIHAQPGAAPTVTVPLIKKGSEVAGVNEVKELLSRVMKAERGYGELSEALIRAYQSHKGFTADGVVGPQTWAGLRGDLK